MKHFSRTLVFALFAGSLLSGSARAQSLISSFETTAEVKATQWSHVQAALSTRYATQGTHSLQVTFLPAAWATLTIPASKPWNAGQAAGIAVDVTNPNDTAITLFFKATDQPNLSGSSATDFRCGHCGLEPHQTKTFLLPCRDSLRAVNFGMNSLPYPGMYTANALSGANPFDPSHLYAYEFSLQNPTGPTTLYFDNVRTIATVSLTGLVDAYGQSTRSDWSGKISQDRDFGDQAAAEQADLSAHPAPKALDSYGGWTGGPTLTATGWFRTAKVQNKWWLVTPSGHLFFDLGIDSVRADGATFTTGRTSMFQWLPDASDPLAAYDGTASGAIGGPISSGATYDFYSANLDRKYGASAYSDWISAARRRLPSWGFNTAGVGSDSNVCGQGMPYALKIDVVGSYPTLPTGTGTGVAVPDPWNPAYQSALVSALQQVVPGVKSDPDLEGYFVENEPSWAGNGPLGRYTLALQVLTYSSATWAAKQQMMAQLQDKYSTVTALNQSWGTAWSSWTVVAAGVSPPSLNAACESDLSDFTLVLARQYYQTVSAELKKQDSHHLFLGSRFNTNYLPPEVLQACTESADVVSMNIYEPRLNLSEWGYLSSLDKPCIVGEFSMGALDHGSYSPGIIATPNQTARAAMFQDYVHSALSLPFMVGINWFEYIDQPTVGTALMGENGNMGFVSTTDTPYPELIAGARAIGQNLYSFRSNATSVSVTAGPGQSGSSAKLSAYVSRVDTGKGVSGVPVTFSVDGTNVGTATTSAGGTAGLSYISSAGTASGTHELTATFPGNAGNSASVGQGSLTITPVPTALTVANVSVPSGGTCTLSATLTRSDTGAALGYRNVQFSVNGAVVGMAETDSSGKVLMSDTISGGTAVGNETILAQFSGDPSDGGASRTGTLAVSSTPTVVVVANLSDAANGGVTLRATLTRSDTGAPLQGKTVKFAVDGTTVGTATTYSTGETTIGYRISVAAKAGSHPITVSFAGDATDHSATGTGTLTVLDLPTATSVSSASGSAGKVVSLSATLKRSDTGAPLQGKTVTFTVNGVSIGTGTTISTGVAYRDYTVPSGTAAGTQKIKVIFSGDASDVASSGTANLTIK